jgi:hypothetical protein
MGGIGSGRKPGYSDRKTVSQMRCIDIRTWKREGLLKPGVRNNVCQWLRDGKVTASIFFHMETDRVVLSYYAGEVYKEYAVQLDFMPCHLGGSRVWFLCPSCGKRAVLLYGGADFACKRCHNLAHDCQRERRIDRALRQADKVREKLGWRPGFLNGQGRKPKGMHWETHYRLLERHDGYADVAWLHVWERCGLPPA